MFNLTCFAIDRENVKNLLILWLQELMEMLIYAADQNPTALTLHK